MKDSLNLMNTNFSRSLDEPNQSFYLAEELKFVIITLNYYSSCI